MKKRFSCENGIPSVLPFTTSSYQRAGIAPAQRDTTWSLLQPSTFSATILLATFLHWWQALSCSHAKKLSPAYLLPETMHICNLLLEGGIFCTKYSRLLLRRANVHPTGVSELEWGPALLVERGQLAAWIKQLFSVPKEWISPYLPLAGSQRSHQKLIHQPKGLSVVTLMAQLRHLCTQCGICSRCLCHMRSNMPFS